MTRSEKTARIDAFLSNEDNFVAVAYSDPHAVAIRAKAAKRHARTQKARETAAAASLAAAMAFEAGQPVKLIRRPFVTGNVVAIKGEYVTLDDGSTYVASALVAA